MAAALVAATPTVIVRITSTSILVRRLLGSLTRMIGKCLTKKHLKVAALGEIVKVFGYHRRRMGDCLEE
jgi:hypothetical protein